MSEVSLDEQSLLAGLGWSGCPVCTCSNLSLVARVGHRGLTLCALCRHVFWRERAECDEVKAYYQIRYGSDHNQLTQMIANQDYYEHYIDELLLLTGIRKARAFFVDYGASSPIFSLAATRRGVYRSLAVDWDENARAYGAERGLTCFAPDEFERRTAAAARESKE